MGFTKEYKIKKSEFFDSEKYDFSSAIFDKNILKTFTKSGLLDISLIIQKELYDRYLLDSIFVEFNVLGTLLDEKSPNKLNSLVYIREGISLKDEKSTTPFFADSVCHFSNLIISELYKKFGYTIFYHPDVFIEQDTPKVTYSIIDPHVNSRAVLSFPKEIGNDSNYLRIGRVEGFDSDSEPWVGGPANIILGNSVFERNYEGIIETARNVKKKEPNVKEAIRQFHRYYHNYIANNRRTVYMAIPILGAFAGNRNFVSTSNGVQGQGVVFLFFTIPQDYSLNREIRIDLDNLAESLFNRIGSLVRLLTYNYIFNVGLKLSENARKEALKSAVSAIMSRNMSHNLGSHYLYYTKSYLESLANTSGEKGPDIRGAAKVLEYMQARMDYLATIISNDRYPNGAVNFKSQIYDELTIDDFSKRHFLRDNDRGKRTTNFLLSNLVMSENFTRSNVLDNKNEIDKEKVGKHFMPIRLQVKLWDGKGYELFTGVSDKEILEGEKGIKNELSKLNIALPGGTMSCHAFFNILENFIRNSAKYIQSDFKEEGLVFTIAIRRNYSDATKFDFIVYDNKMNAKKVLPVVTDQLANLRILDDAGGVEKSSKGLKEMIFSSVWMRTYKYPLMTFADVINIIQNTESGYEKLRIIEEYGFKFVSVSDSGEIMNEQSPNGNLGLLITLPEFKIATNFVLNEHDTEKDVISRSLGISSDIVCFDEDVEKKAEKKGQLLSYFTRLFFEREFKEDDYLEFCKKTKVIAKDDQTARLVYQYKRILDKRFNVETGGDIDNMCLWVGDTRDCKRIPQDNGRIIYFERHLSTKKEGFEPYEDYAYVDSISGGNFTITINSLIEDGLSEFKYKTWYDKLYGLKIKESALTKITLIDERLYNSMKSDGLLKEKEYSFRNVRVMNVNLEKADTHKWTFEEILEGNSFRDNSNKTHFLSIHLGLIEKVVKSEWGDALGKESSIEERVTCFMQQLRDYFGGEPHDVFISVHSGRGNFSKELEGPLASYPFISLAAIENAFSNSKFLLSQLFYNTVYIGKGIING